MIFQYIFDSFINVCTLREQFIRISLVEMGFLMLLSCDRGTSLYSIYESILNPFQVQA